LVPLALNAAGNALKAEVLKPGQPARPAGPTPHGGQTLYIYRNTSVLPRAFLVTGRAVFPTGDDVLAALRGASTSDVGDTAYLTKADAALLPAAAAAPAPSGGAGSATVTSYETDALTVHVVAAQQCLLVVSDNYSPYWRATVDGERVAVARVDHTFMAVPVDAGAHSVRLQYEPPYRWWPG
jgi:hypothetical protein